MQTQQFRIFSSEASELAVLKEKERYSNDLTNGED